jgi:hypothetical protein
VPGLTTAVHQFTTGKIIMQTPVAITVSLTANQAEAFAQFLKRVGLSDYAALAQGQQEAYAMLSAGEAIRDELASAGYAPR